MKRYAFLCLVLILMLSSLVEARDYHLLKLNMDAQVGADGAVRVVEEHTVRFEGKYSGLFQWFDTSRGLELRDLTVSENGIIYTQIQGDKPGPAGTYFVRTKKDQVYVDWSFDAIDETRTFQLSYTLDNMILKHQDVAEFYYQFVGKEWEKPRELVQVTLTLPSGATSDEIGAWGYGPLQGQVQIISPTEVVWELTNLPARTFVEGRVVFPLRLVPGSTRTTNRLGLPAILAREEQREKEAACLEGRKRVDPYVALVIAVLAYTVIIYLWYNYGKPHPGFEDKYYKNLPASYSPAELAILYSGTIGSKDLTATIFDLARRGFLTIEEEKGTYRFRVRGTSFEQQATLLPYEKRVLKFLFHEVKEDEVTVKEIQSFAKSHSKKFNQFWLDWEKSIKAEAAKRDFYEDQSHKKVWWFLVPSIILLVGAIPLFILEMLFSGSLSVIAGFSLLLTTALAAARRSPQGNFEYTQWKAFRRYLKDFSRVETANTASPGIWENLLPYAITLGVASQVLKEWDVVFPNLMDECNLGITWFVFAHGGNFTQLSKMTTDLNNSISGSIQSGGGGGGGFSSGGGGGFGGGGGGAR